MDLRFLVGSGACCAELRVSMQSSFGIVSSEVGGDHVLLRGWNEYF